MRTIRMVLIFGQLGPPMIKLYPPLPPLHSQACMRISSTKILELIKQLLNVGLKSGKRYLLKVLNFDNHRSRG